MSHAINSSWVIFDPRVMHSLKRSRPRIQQLQAGQVLQETVPNTDFAVARESIGDEAFDAAFEEGRTLDEDSSVAYGQRARGERKRPTSGWQSLPPTELEVVRLVGDGLTNKQIAQELLMGAETVKTHLSHVYDKLNIRSRTALATAYSARRRA
jgi:DNA-binding NarL/FixJ family response regulator